MVVVLGAVEAPAFPDNTSRENSTIRLSLEMSRVLYTGAAVFRNSALGVYLVFR